MKEKVVICTLYDSINCGTFLQAYSLKKVIENLGYEVFFLELKNNNTKINSNYKELNKKELLIKAIRKVKLHFVFRNSSSSFNLIDLNDVNNNTKIKNIVIGSDEIWNIKNKSFEHYIEYFGYNFKNKKIIAYAPSANDVTSIDLKEQYKNINFDNFKFLSSRDYNTKKLLEEFDRKDVTDVLDPTMIIDSFEEIEERTNLKNYIIVYGHRFTTEQIYSIKKFAKEKKLKIVSITKYFDWCDNNIVASPGKFLSYLKNANYIISGTFHGTVFSILFNKEFAVYVNNGSKIIDLLNKFELKDRIIESNISTIMDRKINYKKVNLLIEEYKEKSLNYLTNALKENKNV